MKRTVLFLVCFLAFGAIPLLAADPPVCISCHDEVVATMSASPHMNARRVPAGHATGCEGCHGSGAKHAAEGDPSLIRNPEQALDWNAVCLECHTKKLGEWATSRHQAEDVACTECHTVHKPGRKATAACNGCHQDVTARMQMPSRHPLREGAMTCASCHDVHSNNEAALKTKQRVNDLCYSCHQAQEGPFIFEHQPVQEDCRACHDPHGTPTDKLLIANEPALCLQCHDFHFHASYTASTTPLEFGGQTRISPYGAQSFNVGFTTKCTQCHSRIHGTDLPSNGLTHGGRGLTR
ncbi:MAG: DmsE family decaheme c-type cytochrome [Thermoanaerobaculia bacterium]